MLLRTPCARRIARIDTSRTPWRTTALRCYTSANSEDPPWFQQLRAELLQRGVTHIPEHITVSHEYKLAQTLSGFLPREWCHPTNRRTRMVPLGHHLVWFNPAVLTHELLADGTDPAHSPGGPWVRRMWAGGSIHLRPDDYYDYTRGFTAENPMAGTEHIKHARLHGEGDTAKIFVTIERRFARLDTLENAYKAKHRPLGGRGSTREIRDYIEQQLRDGDEWGDAILKEERNLVFFKERTAAELEAVKAGQMATVKYLEPPGKPEFAHSLTPNRALLFRFSALTFNAHLIHLDPDYARNVEGHRNLLVHGPLSLMLMLKTIKHHVETHTKGKHVLESIEYRNLAPLYCDEEMRICGLEKKKSLDGSTYDVWIEGPTGGVAVKGTVYTTVKKTTPNQAPIASASVVSTDEPRTLGRNFRRPDIPAFQSRMHKTRKAVAKMASNPKGSNQDYLASRDKRSSQESSASSKQTASPKSTATSEPTTSFDSTTSSEPTTSSESSPSSELASQPEGEISNKSTPSETASQSSSREVTAATAQTAGRAYRRKRPTNITAYNFIIIPPSAAPAVRLVDAPKPVKPTLSPRSRELLRRARRSTQPEVFVEPIPLVRRFRARPYIPNPDRTASRHSRYLREGVRKMEKASIRFVAEMLERAAER